MSSIISEKLLLYRIRNKKDPDAFAELYDTYVASVYRFVYFKLSNKEEAEDITSEIFMKAWDYLTQDDNDTVGNFRALIYSMARNRVIDAYRERAARKEFPIEDAAQVPSSVNIHIEADIRIEAQKLLDLLKRLKQEYQEVIHLKHIEGLTIREIAKVLDKSSGSVRVTLHRAVRKLQELSKMGMNNE